MNSLLNQADFQSVDYRQKGKIWNTEKENKLTFIINACPSSYFMYTLSSALWNMIHVLWFPATERRPSLTLRCHQILQIFPSSCWEGPFSVTFCEGLPFPLWKMVLSLDELPPCNLRIIKTNRILMIEPLADIWLREFPSPPCHQYGHISVSWLQLLFSCPV